LTPDERDARLEALNAALTSWPRVEFVRMERRWRGLKADDVEAGIFVVVWLLVGRYVELKLVVEWRKLAWVAGYKFRG
jgi:hypothetical protein